MFYMPSAQYFKHINFPLSCKQWLRTCWNMTYHITILFRDTFFICYPFSTRSIIFNEEIQLIAVLEGNAHWIRWKADWLNKCSRSLGLSLETFLIVVKCRKQFSWIIHFTFYTLCDVSKLCTALMHKPQKTGEKLQQHLQKNKNMCIQRP